MKRLVIFLVIVSAVVSGCGYEENTHKNSSGLEQEFNDCFKAISQYPVSSDMAELLFINSLSSEEVTASISSTPVPDINMENAMDTAMGLLGVKTDWPKDYLSPDMPPYTKGKINGWNSGGRGEYDIFILIRDTDSKDLEEYIKVLVNNGFSENNGSYTKDAFTVKFQLNTDTLLQITSYRVEAVEWPELLAFIPPLTKGYLVEVVEPTEDVTYGSLYFKGLTREDIKEWEAKLIAAGFTVDSGEYLKKNVKYKNKNCTFSACFDSSSIDEWGLYFSFD